MRDRDQIREQFVEEFKIKSIELQEEYKQKFLVNEEQHVQELNEMTKEKEMFEIKN